MLRGLRERQRQRPLPTAREQAGLLIFGWGTFNLVEGLGNHHVLSIHHVRDDVDRPLPWGLGFLALSAMLIAVGLVLSSRRRRPRGAGRG